MRCCDVRTSVCARAWGGGAGRGGGRVRRGCPKRVNAAVRRRSCRPFVARGGRARARTTTTVGESAQARRMSETVAERVAWVGRTRADHEGSGERALEIGRGGSWWWWWWCGRGRGCLGRAAQAGGLRAGRRMRRSTGLDLHAWRRRRCGVVKRSGSSCSCQHRRRLGWWCGSRRRGERRGVALLGVPALAA